MKFALLGICIVGAICLLVLRFGITPQQRGLGGERGDILISNGRPALAIVPAAGMRLTDSGRCSFVPSTREVRDGGARLWYARYTQGAAILVAALAETDEPWRWPHGNGTAFRYMRLLDYPLKGQTVHESTYILDAATDPFALKPDEKTLVRRCVLLQHFRRVQVIVEYREAATPGNLPIEDDVARLASFEERARASFAFLFREAGDALPTNIQALNNAQSSLSRRLLARWAGEVYREGQF